MKNVLTNAGNALMVLTVIYIAYFALWLMLISACVSSGNECGGDSMTRSIRMLYPVALFTNEEAQ